MVIPTQDAIDIFVSITGVSEAVAVQKLAGNGGDLNRAINAHFSEVDTYYVTNPVLPRAPRYIHDPFNGPRRVHLMPINQSLNPFSLLNSIFPQSFYRGIGNSGFSTFDPWVSHPRETRQVPGSFLRPRIEDVTGSELGQVPEIQGIVSTDDDTPTAPANHISVASANESSRRYPGPSISPVINDGYYNNEIEEKMIRAAVEASKHETEHHTAEEQQQQPQQQGAYIGVDSIWPSIMEAGHGRTIAPNGSRRQGFSSARNETSRQPPVQNRSRCISSGKSKTADIGQHDMQGKLPQPSYNEHAFQTDEWGVMSSEERDEAIMLEAAMFGAIPEEMRYRLAYGSHQGVEAGSYRNSRQRPRIPNSPSTTLTPQRLLREQHDAEYLAAVRADQEKELKSQQESEYLRLEEIASREATLAKQKLEEEEDQRQQLEEVELEKKLAAKEASLPDEPSSDDENAVTLLVRLPDGSRFVHRFLKSDKLQLVFDYIDTGRIVKPGSYKLVRGYPRRAFTDEESGMSLNELGLNIKQESLFLDLI